MTATPKPRAPKVYLVTTPTGLRLVRALTVVGAIGYVVDTTHSAQVASQDDLIRLVKGGTEIEDATVPAPASSGGDVT